MNEEASKAASNSIMAAFRVMEGVVDDHMKLKPHGVDESIEILTAMKTLSNVVQSVRISVAEEPVNE